MRGEQPQQFPFEFFERFFEGDPRQFQRRSEGQGSGFLIDASGYIVTNNHVAGGADEITVTLQDGRKFDANLVGSDPRTDLALIKIEAGKPPVRRIRRLGRGTRRRLGRSDRQSVRSRRHGDGRHHLRARP